MVWLTDPTDSVVQTDVTTVPTTQVTAPATTTPATTTEPTATSAPPISTAVPPTTAPQPVVEPITVSYLDPPPIYEPDVFAELDAEVMSVALGDGFVVGGFMGDVYTPDDDQLLVLDLADGTTTRLDVDELPRGLTVGPGRVAYGEVLRTVPDDPAPEQRFVAISLTSDRAGQTILDVPSPGHPMDPMHEDFYEHRVDGVIDVWNGDQWPPVVIDGVTTDLRTNGGSCVLLPCDRAVALFAASGDLTNGNWPTDSYLLLLHSVATSDVMPAWTVTDALAISDLPRSMTVGLSVEGCTFTGLASDLVPIAVSYEPDGPVTPIEVWAIDESTGLLTELAIDPAWTCQANY